MQEIPYGTFQPDASAAYYASWNWHGKFSDVDSTGKEQSGSGRSSDRSEKNGGFCEASGTGRIRGVQKPGD